MKTFDCVIVGGGMVGAASALSLANLGLTVAVIEQISPKAFIKSQDYDLRVSAISLASEHLLSQLNAWQQIMEWRACPYSRLGVWEDNIAYTEFSSNDIEQPYLGHIVENRLVQLSLWQQIEEHSNISLLCPEILSTYTQYSEHVEIELSSSVISTKLLIAADGANSKVRNIAGIGCTGWNYNQSAMLINVETEMSQQNITWQQFFTSGPIAMLPLEGNKASLVWYHSRDEIKRLVGLSNSELQKEVTQHFPEKLGNINVESKGAFPLTRQHANQYQQHRVLLLGDAAHTINPMAGQGVNLGFKDVKALQTVIATAIGEGENWSCPTVLSRYEKARRSDNLLMMSTMDALYATFSHPSPIVKAARNFGLFIANKTPILKRQALKYACGIN